MPLALSKTDICNGALSLIGQEPLTDLDTDESEEADQCRIHYERTRNQLLEAYPWKFAQATVALTQDVTPTNPDFDYSYQLPADFLSLTFTDLDANGEPYVLEGTRIVTDGNGVTMSYTREMEYVGLYPALFITALEYKLAAKMAFALTKDLRLTGYLNDLSNEKVMEAISREAQQERNSTYVIDSFLSVRNERS